MQIEYRNKAISKLSFNSLIIRTEYVYNYFSKLTFW